MAIRKFLNKYWGWTFLLIPLALQAIFFYFPMVQGAFYSLTNWTGLTYNYKFVGLNKYGYMYQSIYQNPAENPYVDSTDVPEFININTKDDGTVDITYKLANNTADDRITNNMI